MISVPQLLGAVAGVGVIVGIASTLAAINLHRALFGRCDNFISDFGGDINLWNTLRRSPQETKEDGSSKIPITFREVTKNHFSVVLNGALKSSLSIRWFGPKFSPKDVPRFYDVASITEVIEESSRGFPLIIPLIYRSFAMALEKKNLRLRIRDAARSQPHLSSR